MVQIHGFSPATRKADGVRHSVVASTMVNAPTGTRNRRADFLAAPVVRPGCQPRDAMVLRKLTLE